MYEKQTILYVVCIMIAYIWYVYDMNKDKKK